VCSQIPVRPGTLDCPVVHRTVSGAPGWSVWTRRSREKDQRRTTKIHRTVRWCTGLSGEPTVASANGRPRNLRRRVAAPTVGTGHRTVRCAPDSVRCANGPGAATVDYARFGRQSRTGQATVAVRWRTAAPDCPVCHSTEGKDGLPSLPPTAPSCLGAIKGTPRRMEELTKHSLSILRLSHSASTYLIDCVSYLSFVRVVNSLCYVSSSSLGLCACVCCGFVCCVCCSPSLTLVPSLRSLL
jgi:hypothetical protein